MVSQYSDNLLFQQPQSKYQRMVLSWHLCAKGD